MDQSILWFLVILSVVTILAVAENGGCKCPGTVCANGPAGQKCEAKYERPNKCCPVWYCTDKYGTVTTHYGMSSASGGSVVQTLTSRSLGGSDGNLLTGLQEMFKNVFG